MYLSVFESSFDRIEVCMPRALISATICASMIGLTACTVPTGAGTAVRVLCAFADVLVEETELEVAKKAFGDDDQIGSKICQAAAIFLGGDGAQDPSAVTETTSGNLQLPDGAFIPVRITTPSK